MQYHGVLAPAASLRDWIVPGEADESRGAALAADAQSEAAGRTPAADPPTDTAVNESGEQPGPALDAGAKAGGMRWARLLQRVFEIDTLRCPHFGSTLRLVAAIEDPAVARKILECVGLAARAPPLEPALATIHLERAEDDWLYDQAPVNDEP
jgi:hypothetical protein